MPKLDLQPLDLQPLDVIAVAPEGLPQPKTPREQAAANIAALDPQARNLQRISNVLNYQVPERMSTLGLETGLLQGAGKGLMTTGLGGVNLVQRLMGNPQIDTPETRAVTEAQGVPQHIGKFGEQAAEFALPAGAAGRVLKTAPVMARMAAQGGIGTGVSALQTGGDPVATTVGGALGAGGEAGAAAVSALRGAKNLPLAPTLKNWRNSFQSTPIQNIIINKGKDTLENSVYKLAPQNTPQEMQAALRDKLGQMGSEYQAFEDAGGHKLSEPTDTVVKKLEELKEGLKRENVSHPEDAGAMQQIDKQIDLVKELASKKPNGEVNFGDLKWLRDKANGRVNWRDPPADRNIYDATGNIYREGLDRLSPGMRDLNRHYQNYVELEGMLNRNLDMGRGDLISRFQEQIAKAVAPHTGKILGTVIGTGVGHMIHPGFGDILGSATGLAGAAAWPKLTEPMSALLKNAVDSGKFAALNNAKQAALASAVRLGDVTAASRILGSVTKETAVEAQR